ncbi:MAG: hypothetical protein PHX34_02080 [Candidatus Shapirobacteria bacterium]|nr:hypothetical protein [Candidatus Shapirobacteria bacterium]
MLTDTQIDTIKKYISKKFNAKKILLIPISSTYGIKRNHNIRIFQIKLDSKSYILRILKSKNNTLFIPKQISNTKLKKYYPKLIFHNKINDLDLTIETIIIGNSLAKTISSKKNKKKLLIEKNILIKIGKYINIKNKILGEKCNKVKIVKELKKIKLEFLKIYPLSKKTKKIINKKLNELKEEIPKKLIISREVNFDINPENILINKTNFKIIDFEFFNNSTLWIVEPMRIIYMLARTEFNLIQNTKYTFWEYFISETLTIGGKYNLKLKFLLQPFNISQGLIPNLILINLILEELLQYQIYKKPIIYNDVKNIENQIKLINKPTIIFKNKLKSTTKNVIEKNQSFFLELEKIKSSKTFKVWQKFCNTRKKIKYFLKI